MTRLSNFLSRLVSLVRLGRPKFLLGGVGLFGLGTVTAYAMGFGFHLAAYLWGQLAVVAMQLVTHYSNDYFDLHADRANLTPTRWSGGSRVLVRGELPRYSALAAAVFMIVVACAAILVLSNIEHVPLVSSLLIFGGMLVLCWSYSSPPLRFHTRGWGEPVVALVVPFLTPLSGFFVQAGRIEMLPVLLCLPLVGLQLVMLLTLQIPDARGDRRVHKLTWTVLFGVRPIVVLCSALILLSFAGAFAISSVEALSNLRVLWMCLVPLGLYQLSNYRRREFEKPSDFNHLAFGSVALFFLAIVADVVGLLVAADLSVAIGS